MTGRAPQGNSIYFEKRIKISSNACIGLVFDVEFTLLLVFTSHIAKDKRACTVDGGRNSSAGLRPAPSRRGAENKAGG